MVVSTPEALISTITQGKTLLCVGDESNSNRSVCGQGPTTRKWRMVNESGYLCGVTQLWGYRSCSVCVHRCGETVRFNNHRRGEWSEGETGENVHDFTPRSLLHHSVKQEAAATLGQPDGGIPHILLVLGLLLVGKGVGYPVPAHAPRLRQRR